MSAATEHYQDREAESSSGGETDSSWPDEVFASADKPAQDHTVASLLASSEPIATPSQDYPPWQVTAAVIDTLFRSQRQNSPEQLLSAHARLVEFIREKRSEGKTSLLDLISILKEFDDPQDLRDKIYCLLSLLPPQTQQLIQPGNYPQSVNQVFARATYAAICESGGLEPLFMVKPRPAPFVSVVGQDQVRAASLPSWSIDFAEEDLPLHLCGLQHGADNAVLPDLNDWGDRLIIRGTRLGSVQSTAGLPYLERVGGSAPFVHSQAYLLSLDLPNGVGSPYGDKQIITERAMAKADTLASERGGSGLDEQKPASTSRPVAKSHWYWMTYFDSSSDSTEVFSTNGRQIGVRGAREDVRNGEILVWLRGATAAAFLRPNGDGTWRFAGFAYFPYWSSMMKDRNNARDERFVIR